MYRNILLSTILILIPLIEFSQIKTENYTRCADDFSVESGISVIKDLRDGKTYKTVEIGNQIWFAENLKYKSPKSICYKKQKKNCKKHGRLYPFDELKTACPKGWRVPNIEDWEILKSNFSNNPILDLLDKNGWHSAENHRNISGFSLQGAGFRMKKNLFFGEGKATTIWINEMNNFGEFFHAHLYGGEGTYFKATDFQTNEVFHAHPIENLEYRMFSIRCICEKNR